MCQRICDGRDGVLSVLVLKVAVVVAQNDVGWGNVGKVLKKVCRKIKILWRQLCLCVSQVSAMDDQIDLLFS